MCNFNLPPPPLLLNVLIGKTFAHVGEGGAFSSGVEGDVLEACKVGWRGGGVKRWKGEVMIFAKTIWIWVPLSLRNEPGAFVWVRGLAPLTHIQG